MQLDTARSHKRGPSRRPLKQFVTTSTANCVSHFEVFKIAWLARDLVLRLVFSSDIIQNYLQS